MSPSELDVIYLALVCLTVGWLAHLALRERDDRRRRREEEIQLRASVMPVGWWVRRAPTITSPPRSDGGRGWRQDD